MLAGFVEFARGSHGALCSLQGFGVFWELAWGLRVLWCFARRLMVLVLQNLWSSRGAKA